MISYKDKTFCTFYDECEKGESCDRALTPEVVKDATKWWGSVDFPIFRFKDKPKCFVLTNK